MDNRDSWCTSTVLYESTALSHDDIWLTCFGGAPSSHSTRGYSLREACAAFSSEPRVMWLGGGAARASLAVRFWLLWRRSTHANSRAPLHCEWLFHLRFLLCFLQWQVGCRIALGECSIPDFLKDNCQRASASEQYTQYMCYKFAIAPGVLYKTSSQSSRPPLLCAGHSDTYVTVILFCALLYSSSAF